MKIQIIGYSGSGKSTLAQKLAMHYDIPVLHLDNVRFYGDWQERTREEENQIVDKFLDENESWVIDGNYTSVSPQRYEMSDMTIYLNYNKFYCFFKAWGRYRKYKGTHRESCSCNEKFDRAFRKWILFDGRTKERKQQHLSNLNKTKGKKLIFNNVKQLNKWLKGIGVDV